MKRLVADERIKVGRIGEQIARDYLISQQCILLQQNWRCRTGEIDLIMKLDETIVFVEVRTRKNIGHYGTAVESINARKQKKVRATAQVFMYQNHKFDQPVRFDVITVQLNEEGEMIKMDHICDAF